MIKRKTRTYRKQRRLLTGVQKCEHAIMAIGSAIARRVEMNKMRKAA